MRFPEAIQYAGTNETLPVNDMKLTFQVISMPLSLTSSPQSRSSGSEMY